MAKRRVDPIEREKVIAAKERYIQSHKGREWKRRSSTIANALRRSRKSLKPFQWTIDDWNECRIAWDGKCAYCGSRGKLTQDHFVPIAAPDFPGTVRSNMLPACEPCNYSKRDTDPHEFVSDKERLDKIMSYLRSQVDGT